MRHLNIFIILCLFFYSNFLFSWGKTGHRIVGEIAERNLTEKSKSELKKLMGDEKLWLSSTWPDEMRSDPNFKKTTFWHYVSIANNKKYFDEKRNVDGDLIWALFHFESMLRNEKETSENKKNALRFLVHFIGDLHQPLHVGLVEDRGGNSIMVKWFSNHTNLHSVWDEMIIDSEKLSYTEYSDYLGNMTENFKTLNLKGNYFDWAQESMSYRSVIYEIPENKNLGYEYAFKAKPIIEERLKQAGIRTAFILNDIFDHKKNIKETLEINKKIKENI
jgi:hypothetical protein